MSIAIVGSLTLGNDANLSGTTVSCSRTGVAAGNLLACWVSWASAAGTSATVSDPVNGAWTGAGSAILDSTAAQYLQQFYFNVVGTVVGALVVTATINATTTKKTIAMVEISGQSTTSSILVTHKESAGSTANPSAKNASTNRLPSRWVGMAQHSSGSIVANAGDTDIGAGDAESGVSRIIYRDSDLIDITTTTFGVDWTATAASWHALGMCFAEAGAALVMNLQPTASTAAKRSRNINKNYSSACSAGVSSLKAIARNIVTACLAGIARLSAVNHNVALACLAGVARVSVIARNIVIVCLLGVIRLNAIDHAIAAACAMMISRINGVGRAIDVACSSTVSRVSSIARKLALVCSASVSERRLAFRLLTISIASVVTPLRLRNIAQSFIVACRISILARFIKFAVGRLGRLVHALRKSRIVTASSKDREVVAAPKTRTVQ